MAEYIEREAFIQHIEESDLPDMAKRAVIALVRHMPAADVVEVVHGEWIEKQEAIPWCEDDVEVFYECSICGSQSCGESPYCPNCGAKMDGERKD